MEIKHQGFVATLNDEWWEAGEMSSFVPRAAAYTCTDSQALVIWVGDIGPLSEVRRKKGIFLDNMDEGIPARDRVLKILRGFRLCEPIPPVEVRRLELGSQFSYELTHGAHRLHLSIAAGFINVPAIVSG